MRENMKRENRLNNIEQSTTDLDRVEPDAMSLDNDNDDNIPIANDDTISYNSVEDLSYRSK